MYAVSNFERSRILQTGPLRAALGKSAAPPGNVKQTKTKAKNIKHKNQKPKTPQPKTTKKQHFQTPDFERILNLFARVSVLLFFVLICLFCCLLGFGLYLRSSAAKIMQAGSTS